MVGACALVLWQAVSLTVGSIVLGAVSAALLVLAALAHGLRWLGRRHPRLPSLAMRQGLANLARPGGHGTGVVIALGIGVMLLVTVGLLEASLGGQLDYERRRDAPSFFFVDIQPEQRERFANLERQLAGGAEVRGRLKEVTPDGKVKDVKEDRVTIESGSATLIVERSRIVRVGEAVSPTT